MELECQLSENELLDKGQELSTLIQDVKKLDEEKKENAADYKVRIDGKTIDARAIARVIKDGFETRTVEITEQRDYALRTITTFRKDTGEIVQTRPMRTEDLQEPIAFPAEDRHEGKVAYLGDSR